MGEEVVLVLGEEEFVMGCGGGAINVGLLV